jgi:predicted phosphoribosyltransferase
MYREQYIFRDRVEAGKKLAEKLRGYAGPGTTIFAIPRGGVPVSMEVAGILNTSLDIVVPKKIPIPFEPESGFGAVSEDGEVALNNELTARLGLTEEQIQRQINNVTTEIRRRSEVYHALLQKPRNEVKTGIIIDDGLASGFTALAAVKTLRKRRVPTVIVAAPVVSGRAYELVAPHADGLVYVILSRVYPFAVADFYERWYDIPEDELIKYLKAWRQRVDLESRRDYRNVEKP